MFKFRKQEQLYSTCIAYSEKGSASPQVRGHTEFPQAQLPQQPETFTISPTDTSDSPLPKPVTNMGLGPFQTKKCSFS